MAADSDSSGLAPAPRAATLTEARALKAEAQRLVRDWKAAFYVLPRITEQSGRTASCVLCLIGHAQVEVKQLNIHEAKKEPHLKNMQTLGCCS